MEKFKFEDWEFMNLDTIKIYPLYESSLDKLFFEEELNFSTARGLPHKFERNFNIKKEKLQREIWNKFNRNYLDRPDGSYIDSGYFYERILYSFYSIEGKSKQGDLLTLRIIPNLFEKNGRIIIIDEEQARVEWNINLSKKTDLFEATTLEGHFSINPGHGSCESYFNIDTGIMARSRRQNGYFGNAKSGRF